MSTKAEEEVKAVIALGQKLREASGERGRGLSHADRRLMRAVKALAFLRGVPAAEVVRRLPPAAATELPTVATNRTPAGTTAG